MPLVPLTFKPGINRENTDYASEGGWYSCDKVRFRSGTPQKIGGWVKYSPNTFSGVCNALFNWVTLDTKNLLALGTNSKHYVEYGQTYHDITPIRRTVTLGANPFTTTNGSTTVVVTDNTHGAVDGDYVTFSGASGFNGIAAGDLNKEFQITYLTANTYSITVASAANANGAGGGAAVQAEYQINIGQSVQTFGDGWGSSTWGRGTWGSGATLVPIAQLRTWTQTTYGEDLIFCPRNSAIYFWDASGGFNARAVDLSTISGATDTPTVATSVLFTDDRHLVAFGCNPIGTATQDPLFIRWASQESLTDWNPTETNTAGGYRLTSGNYINSYLKMKQETLVWTDSDLYSMQFTGTPYIFSFQYLARNVSIAGPNAMAAAGDVAYWMGHDKFYMYNGRVQTLRCDLWSYVFRDINKSQLWQVVAGTNEGFNEIMWFYPSSGSNTIDRYAVYNYVEDIWYYGSLVRTVWVDLPLKGYPIAAGLDGYLYYQEFGIDDGSTDPASAINAYIESANMDIGEGDHLMFVRRVIPDVTFTGSTAISPSVTLTLKARNFPGSSYPDSAAATTTRTASAPVEQFTNQVWMRLRGRQMAFRIESSDTGVQWQLGKPRVEAQPDGRR